MWLGVELALTPQLLVFSPLLVLPASLPITGSPPPCVGPPQPLCDTILRCGFYFWLCFCLQPSFALTRVAQIALRGTTWGRGLGTLRRNPRVLGEQCSTKEEAGFWWAHSLGLLDTLSCGEGTARAGHSKALLLPDPKATTGAPTQIILHTISEDSPSSCGSPIDSR